MLCVGVIIRSHDWVRMTSSHDWIFYILCPPNPIQINSSWLFNQALGSSHDAKNSAIQWQDLTWKCQKLPLDDKLLCDSPVYFAVLMHACSQQIKNPAKQFLKNSKHFQQEKLNKDLEYLNSSKDDERYTSKVSTVWFTEHATPFDFQLVLARLIDLFASPS